MKQNTIRWLVAIGVIIIGGIGMFACQSQRPAEPSPVAQLTVASRTAIARPVPSETRAATATIAQVEKKLTDTVARSTDTPVLPTRVPPTFTSVPATSTLVPTTVLASDSAPANQIAFTVRGGDNAKIYLMNSDGSNVHPLIDSPGIANSPVWSPDGKWIAFSWTPRSGESGIYIIRPDGTGLKRLTTVRGATPSGWSPDGKLIAFTVSDANAIQHVFVMNADGSYQRQLTNSGSYSGASWSPDGQFLVYTSAGDDDHSAVFRMNTDGSNQIVLASLANPIPPVVMPYMVSSPRFSPDGKTIIVDVSRYHNLYLMGADGSSPRRLGYGYSPSWSPDGHTIALIDEASGDKPTFAVYLMNSDGTNIRPLANIRGDIVDVAWEPK